MLPSTPPTDVTQCAGGLDAPLAEGGPPPAGTPPSSYDVNGDFANCSAEDLRRQLLLERDRGRVLERIAANDLLSHVLECVAGMIERQRPELRACVLVHREAASIARVGGTSVPLAPGVAPRL